MKSSLIRTFCILVFPVLLLTAGCAPKNTSSSGKSPSPAVTATPARSAATAEETAVSKFGSALKNADAQAFRALVSPKGLIVIRNFVSGGNGTRGKNIRGIYKAENITADLKFPVKDETPVDPVALFSAITSMNAADIPVMHTTGKSYGFNDNGLTADVKPGTNDAIGTTASLISGTSSVAGPKAIVLDSGEMLLTKSEYISGLPIGVFAVFEIADGQYYLRALMDLR